MAGETIRDKKWYKCVDSLLIEAFLTLRNQEDLGHKWVRVDFTRRKGKDIFVIIDGNIGAKTFEEPEIVDDGIS